MVATCIVREVKRQEIRSTFLGAYVAGGRDKASWAIISSVQGTEISERERAEYQISYSPSISAGKRSKGASPGPFGFAGSMFTGS